MGERILVDTDVLIDYYRGKAELPAGNIYYISVITLYEYVRGTRRPEIAKKLLEESFVTLSLTNEVLLKSAEIWREMKARGEVVDDRDLIVGVTAIVYGLRLMTKNKKHFGKLIKYNLKLY